MRYEIKAGKVQESIFIDAPYDTKQDALDALNDGVYEYTAGMESPIPWESEDHLYSRDRSRF